MRKVRISRPGGGKSGGYRLVYFFPDTKLPLFLLTMFAKNEKANLTPGDRKELIILCNQIANSYGKRT